MPRLQRPAFEVAVASSPLFKLALEVRFMIYEMLLIQEGGMSITSDTFARRNYRRTGSVPQECFVCGLVFLSNDGCTQHIAKYHGRRMLSWRTSAWPLLPLLPKVSISFLQTCRLIRLEASPILYSRNKFHFPDSATASNFRWSTDCAQAVQEIGINFDCQQHWRVTPWVTYLTKRTLSLGQDFPHLRRMTINLRSTSILRVENPDRLRSTFESFRERSGGLEWVLVLMLSHKRLLGSFEPLVNREDEPTNDKKEVRKCVWADKLGPPLTNAFLWWGSPAEAVPQKYRVVLDQAQYPFPSDPADEVWSIHRTPSTS